MKKILIALILLLSINVYADFTETVCAGSSCFSSTNLTINGDSGTATYDPSTKTMTLNNFKYHGMGYNLTTVNYLGYTVESYNYALIYSDTDLNIIVIGECELSTPDTSTRTNKNLTYNIIQAKNSNLKITGTENSKINIILDQVYDYFDGMINYYYSYFTALSTSGINGNGVWGELSVENVEINLTQNTDAYHLFYSVYFTESKKLDFKNVDFNAVQKYGTTSDWSFYFSGFYTKGDATFDECNIDIQVDDDLECSYVFYSSSKILLKDCETSIGINDINNIFYAPTVELINGSIRIYKIRNNGNIFGFTNIVDRKLILDNIDIKYETPVSFGGRTESPLNLEVKNYPSNLNLVYDNTTKNYVTKFLELNEETKYTTMYNLRFVESGELTTSIANFNEYYELTEEDQNYMKAGNDITVSIINEELTDPTESIINSVNNKKGNGTIIGYYNIEVVKEMDTNVVIPELKKEMTQEITIDDQYINNDPKVTRTYKVIRIHGDDVDTLDAAFDPTTKKLTFKSDKYSVFGVVYYDTNINNPKTGDNLIIYLLLSFISFLTMITIKTKRA